MNYSDALNLMHEWTANDSLRKHMYAVEAAMRAYAKKFNQDETEWAITGLLHDFDYERYPSPPEHPRKGSEVLKELGYPDEVRIAILGHASFAEVPRTSLLAKTLYAVDELCGLITAVAVIRPNKIMDLEVASVRKKFKDKAFAKNVNRAEIEEGAKDLGIELDVHIRTVIEAMKSDAVRLGLAS